MINVAMEWFNKIKKMFKCEDDYGEQKEVPVRQLPILHAPVEDSCNEISEESFLKETGVQETGIEDVSIDELNETIGLTEIAPILIKEESQPTEQTFDLTCDGKGNFEKLLSNTLDTIKYYDRLADQIQSADAKTVLNDLCRKLIENLILSGCKPIDEPHDIYDMSRHKVIPFQIVPEGTKYTNLIRPGIEYNDEVKLLAIVEL